MTTSAPILLVREALTHPGLDVMNDRAQRSEEGERIVIALPVNHLARLAHMGLLSVAHRAMCDSPALREDVAAICDALDAFIETESDREQQG